ncbi:hypothetical protein Zmor_020433 [Zophobas morio]|uniref:Gustatory receptor n=1 Tax=Zophobas morio TaxID=2755281 RepID=A0AA38I7L3_9CUCU|nr:hypothetical protein Zmor_020433 [Zophobas morio]
MHTLEDIPVWLQIIYKIHGVWQFNSNNESRFSKITAYVWCLPLYIFYLYCFGHWLYDTLVYRGLYNFLDNVDFLTSLVSIFTLVFTIALTCMRKNSLERYLQKLERTRQKLTSGPRVQRIKLPTRFEKIVLLLTLSNHALANVFDNFYEHFFYYIPPMVCSFNVMFLCNLLQIISHEYNEMNKNIREEETVLERKCNLDDTQITKIEQLSLLHHDLTMLALHINNIFSTRIVVAMILWFITTVNISYNLVFYAPRQLYLKWMVYIISMLLFFNLSLMLLLSTCSSTQEEANKTADYVHDVWNRHILRKVDKNLRHLQLICVRLLNAKLKFTAKQFFNLDWTFYHMMIAGIATYLVILMQFNL